MPFDILDLTDPGLLCEINNAGLPWVNLIDAAKAAWLIAHAARARLACLNGRPAGVIVVLAETTPLESEYLDWFKQRYHNYIYIDRVSVAPWARGQGVARALFADVAAFADQHGLTIVSELYSDPLNVPSYQLHTAMGFVQVGEQFCQRDGKWVIKLGRGDEMGGGSTRVNAGNP
jgi:predicted GNAT superfamily acetyltransferase